MKQVKTNSELVKASELMIRKLHTIIPRDPDFDRGDLLNHVVERVSEADSRWSPDGNKSRFGWACTQATYAVYWYIRKHYSRGLSGSAWWGMPIMDAADIVHSQSLDEVDAECLPWYTDHDLEEVDERLDDESLYDSIEDDRTRDIMRRRFRHGNTLVEIGDHYGLSKERIRQIVEHELQTIRKKWGLDE